MISNSIFFAQKLLSMPDFIDLLGNFDIFAVLVGHVPLQGLQDIKSNGIIVPDKLIGASIMCISDRLKTVQTFSH